MRKLLLLLFSALFVLSAQAEDVLRLMTYNVRNANGVARKFVRHFFR
nr:hypothetical protein [Bacteroides fragilis]